MPTALRQGPYRLFFYSDDRLEPPHVHVEREECCAKFWLRPVRVADPGGFGGSELRGLQRLVVANADQLSRAWDEFFGF